MRSAAQIDLVTDETLAIQPVLRISSPIHDWCGISSEARWKRWVARVAGSKCKPPRQFQKTDHTIVGSALSRVCRFEKSRCGFSIPPLQVHAKTAYNRAINNTLKFRNPAPRRSLTTRCSTGETDDPSDFFVRKTNSGSQAGSRRRFAAKYFPHRALRLFCNFGSFVGYRANDVGAVKEATRLR